MLVGRSAGHKFLRVRTDPAHPGRDRASLGLDSPLLSNVSLILSLSLFLSLFLYLSIYLSTSFPRCNCISCSERRRNVETRVESGPTPTLAYQGPFNSPSLFFPHALLHLLPAFRFFPVPPSVFPLPSSSRLFHYFSVLLRSVSPFSKYPFEYVVQPINILPNIFNTHVTLHSMSPLLTIRCLILR